MFLTVIRVGGSAVEYNLEAGAETSVSELKRLVQDDRLPAKAFRLIYEGRTLREGKSLKASGVKEGGTVEMSMRLRGGSFSFIGFLFPSLKNGKKRQLRSTAPHHKTVYPGLNLKGRCKNKSCVAFDRHVWCRFGFSNSSKQATAGAAAFDIDSLSRRMKCPECKSALPYDSLVACGFYKCCYSYQGYQQVNAGAIKGGGRVDFKHAYERHNCIADSKVWTTLAITVQSL